MKECITGKTSLKKRLYKLYKENFTQNKHCLKWVIFYMNNNLDLINEERIRRIFRARNKICYPQACCHITQRAPGRELLFIEESDYLYMLYLLKESAKKFAFDLYSFVLMPNHLHLLLRLTQANLSQAMKNICERYAKVFNKKYVRKGHVFCGPYRQALCFDDSYLLASSLYIHLNPLKAGLIDKLGEYRWSSCKLYTETIKRNTFVNYEFILKTLHQDIEEARKIYRELLERSAVIKTQQTWEHCDAIEKFRTNLFSKFGSMIKKIANISCNESSIFKDNLLEEKINEIKKNRYSHNISNVKTRKYLIEQLRASGYKMEEIAEKLSLSRKTIYNTRILPKTSIA